MVRYSCLCACEGKAWVKELFMTYTTRWRFEITVEEYNEREDNKSRRRFEEKAKNIEQIEDRNKEVNREED